MIMKQTPFAWLVSRFFSKPSVAQGGTATAKGKNSIARGGANGDGTPGQVVITDNKGTIIFDSFADPKIPVVAEPKPLTTPEKWLNNLKKNYKPGDLVMLSEGNLTKMHDIDTERWLSDNALILNQSAIFIPAIKNVAILKS